MKRNLFLLLHVLFLIACQKEIIQNRLELVSNPLNAGKFTPELNLIEQGQSIELIAIPNSDYLFKNWSGALSGTQNPIKFTMDGDKKVIGNFEKKLYPLNVTINGEGVVKEEVVNISSNSIYPSGTLVKLTANPAENWYFFNWSGDTITIENSIQLMVRTPKQLVANFIHSPFDLKVNVIGKGTYKKSLYRSIQANKILLEAVPDTYSVFDSWSGDLSSNDKSITVPMDKPYTLNLTFYKKVKIEVDTAKSVPFVQRNNLDLGVLPIYFKSDVSFDAAKIKFKPLFGGKETSWMSLSKTDSTRFGGKVTLNGGAYTANLVLVRGNAVVLDTLLVDAFKVGEIFGVIGNSLAEGQDPYDLKNYDKTKSTVVTWPWSTNVSFWGRLGELLASKLNVPVLIYNTGLGGSTTVQWGLSSEGLPFEHAFYDWKKRYPYSIFEESFFKYIPKSGVRAILVMHGENDRDNTEDENVLNAQRYINFTRKKLDYAKLQFSICRCGNASVFSWYQKVLNSQTRIVNEIPYTSWGGFVNDLQGDQYRWDGIHLNYTGLEGAAKKWDTALDLNFFKNSTPFLVN
ncbi:InlB B-repeat-containing protein [Aquirufa sp. ROCK-SH2]